MRYVIVSIVKGEAGAFNNNLRQEVREKLGAKSSSLPAHITLKAPFEYADEITEVEDRLQTFCKSEAAQPFNVEGYDHFDDRVIYMKVNMSSEGQAMHDRFIDEMSKVPYICFDKKDGKDKVFHITVSSKKIQSIYKQLWKYVHQYPCEFECQFDNISIYKWESESWKLFREFELKV